MAQWAIDLVVVVVIGSVLLVQLFVKGLNATACTQVSACAVGWEEIASPRMCIKHFKQNGTYADAERICQDHSGEVIMPYALEMKYALLDSLLHLPRNRFWLGISDEEEEGSWMWKHNYTREYSSWAATEGSHNTGENCAMSDPHGAWFDTECMNVNQVLCQAESLGGPKDVEIVVYYHLPPNIVFKNGTVDILCSAVNAEHEELVWIAHNVDDEQLQVMERSIVEEITTDLYGCVNKTFSVYSVKVTPALTSLRLSCFAYKLVQPKQCAKPRASYSFCDLSRSFVIKYDGPLEQPSLVLNYEGEPDPVLANSRVNASCSFRSGGDSTLLWVVYFPTGPRVFDSSDDPVTTSITDLGKKEKLIHSELEFVIRIQHSGIRIACFAYDLRSYGLSVECGEWDRYCAMSDQLTVKSPTITIVRERMVALSEVLITISIPVLLFFLLVIFMCISRGKTKQKPAVQGAEDYMMAEISSKMARELEESDKLQRDRRVL